MQPELLERAWRTASDDLLAERNAQGHWVGELCSSALSTATAISALSLVERHARTTNGRFADEGEQLEFNRLIVRGLRWLAERQNPDGGWGDTDKSLSNIATTMLVQAAFHLTAVPADHADLLERAEGYVKSQGGLAGLRKRYGKDKTFAVPILTNCALAGLVSWKEVAPLPFELACFPQKWYGAMRLPVVSYAIPALVAIGQARYFHQKPLNPISRYLRRACVEPSLQVVERMQPDSGGFLEATPLTSFVVMSLASIDRARHPITQAGVRFLLDSVRPDGSWPIDTNLATWNTTLALNALAVGDEDVTQHECLDWLLSCQHLQDHPFTGAAPGGWGWSDLSGAVPDADDTPGALLALSHWMTAEHVPAEKRGRVQAAARHGIRWLLDLQNGDGGIPTFCRGWGALPFDRSAADLTAHALRAWHAWRDRLDADGDPTLAPARLARSMERGFAYLAKQQRRTGSWVPLWFGNQYHADEENPVYGTAKVLLAYRDCGLIESESAQRGYRWLVGAQNRDGGWGQASGSHGALVIEDTAQREPASGVEETALAVEALLAAGDAEARCAAERGVEWLIRAVEADRHRDSTPIGFYFAKLWYYERLYPLIFTVSALGQAARRLHTTPQPTPTTAHLGNA